MHPLNSTKFGVASSETGNQFSFYANIGGSPELVTIVKQTGTRTFRVTNGSVTGDVTLSNVDKGLLSLGEAVIEINTSGEAVAELGAVTLAADAVSSVAVTWRGEHNEIPTVTISGDGAGATAVARMRIKSATVVVIDAGSADAVVGDDYTVTNGTNGTGADVQIEVTELDGLGGVAAATVSVVGSEYTALIPSDTNLTTTYVGGGTGDAVFQITDVVWEIESINVTAGGSGYTAATALADDPNASTEVEYAKQFTSNFVQTFDGNSYQWSFTDLTTNGKYPVGRVVGY